MRFHSLKVKAKQEFSTPNASRTLLITCEHATNFVPKKYQKLFDPDLLKTHRGWDPGALELAQSMAKAFKAPLIVGEVSRLLVELNRTVKIFSPFVPQELHQELLDTYYHPYWDKVKKALKAQKNILHLSIHSFTPVYEGRVRKADIGILYDPKVEDEKNFATHWQQALKKEFPHWVIGKNTPYRGTSDGLVTALRPLFRGKYIGIELEMNQKHIPFDQERVIATLAKIC